MQKGKLYLLTMWIINDANATTHPQPPSGGTGKGVSSNSGSSLSLFLRGTGGPWVILIKLYLTKKKSFKHKTN